MHVRVAPELTGVVRLGVLASAGATNAARDVRLDEPLAAAESTARRAPPEERQAVRTMYRRLGIDPTKTRPSSEALLRRVLQGKGLPRVHPLVDACNLCSLEYQLPLGLYDRDLVKGSVLVRVGRENEGYPGIRKQWVNLAGRLLLADEEGPFGAPTSDSRRTAVTSTTGNALVVVFGPPERAGDLSTALERIADVLGRYCQSRIVAVRVLH